MSHHHHHEELPCAITGKITRHADLTPLGAVRPKLAAYLREQHPQLDDDSLISIEALNDAREDYVRDLLATQLGELSQLEEEVVQSLHHHELLAENPDDEEENLTFGQRVADKMAAFGGSWSFIIAFGCVLVVWMLVNALVLRGQAFDPYPFILLNLVLSCLAALQAPVIMMSQKRQEERDRHRAQSDYKVNLKAELEIRHLHEKMDYLLKKNSERMMEVQQIQLDLMREISRMRR